MISDETIREVMGAVDIVEVIHSLVPLKRAGANYKARCPFHEEKTPSFNVHPERQIFKCFGCGKGGNVVGFVMEFQKLDYPEAIRALAERAGIQVKYTGGGPAGPGREDLYKVSEWAAGVFRGLLEKSPEAAEAGRFLVRRGVSDETRAAFGLGYSLDGWDGLVSRARRAGFDEKLLVAAGLAVERESKSGVYDRFRGRLMFPIGDTRGKTVAFGARTLKDEQPKFLNSPETAIFAKGRGFYGLHAAKETWEETRTAYIVEGYLDVIVPWQAGVKGLVATLGTALTYDHLKILRRYVDRVVLVFDADAAGQKASERGLDMLLSENMDIFVAELPAGLDPDDVVVKHGPDRLRACLEKPREIFEFLLASLTARHGGDTPAAKARVVQEITERLRQIPNPIKQEILVQALAQRFGLSERTLRAQVARPAEPAAAPAPRAEVTPLEKTARELLACAVADSASAGRLRKELPASGYPTEATRKVAEAAYAILDETGEIGRGALMARLQDGAAMEVAAEILWMEVDRERAAARLAAGLDALAKAEFRSESRARRARLKNASPEDRSTDEELRRVMEARRARPHDRGLIPGR